MGFKEPPFASPKNHNVQLLNEVFQLGETLSALEAGQVILYPTDTIWGLGCDATNSEAVERLLKIKQRSSEQGVVMLVDSIDMLRRHVEYIHPRLQTLLSHHKRPLTMIYPDPVGLASNATASDGSAAIRVCRDAYCRELIGSFGKPLTSTSANIHGDPFPGHYGSISSEVLRHVDHVVKYRQRETTDGEPSLIARWNDSNEIEPVRE